MKKGLLLFLIVLPMALSYECVTYDDCYAKNCLGSVRVCSEGVCIFSDCVADASAQDFISITGRVILLAMVAIIIALLLSLAKLQGRARAIAFMLAAGFLAVLSLYIFSDTSLALDSRWDSEAADQAIRNVMSKKNYDVEEELFTFNGGPAKLYMLNSPLYEHSVVAFEGTAEEVTNDECRIKAFYHLQTYLE